LLQKTYPSWLYPVTAGATTIWERWDGIKPDSSFEESSMNSFNHYSYGAIGDWMYSNIAGIQASSPGYKRILIKPVLGGGITWTKASHMSPYGVISVNWDITGNAFKIDVTIPPNTTAEIDVPDVKATGYQKHYVTAGTYTYHR